MHAPRPKTDHRVLVVDDIADSGLAILRRGGHQVGRVTEDPTAIFCRSTQVFPAENPYLVAIARAGTGTDNIRKIEDASARGIPVFFAPGENAQSVNELVFTVLGLYARDLAASILFRDKLKIEGLTAKTLKDLLAIEKGSRAGFELQRKTLGVIGLGNIGRPVANGGIRRGMQVIAFDPLVRQLDDRFDAGIELADNMNQVLRRAEIITIHVPYLGKSLIGAEEIAQMRNGTILINYARGELVDEAALISGLDSKLKHYLTDFPTLCTVDHRKVQWTEHLGAATKESEERCAVTAAQELEDYLACGVVRNAVNFPDMTVRPRQGFPMRLAIPHRNVPGQLKVIMDVLATAGANIGPQHNDVKNGIGYCVVDLEQPIDDEKIAAIKSGHENIIDVRVFRF